MRRVIGDILVSACALGVLLAGIVAMDGTVRERLAMQMDSAHATAEISASTAQAHRMAGVVFQIVKDQGETHGPLMAMLVVGVVLMVIMFRT
jgi:hypothetical protein